MSDYEKKIAILDNGFVQYIDHMGDDASIPQAARVSYSKGTKGIRDDETLMRFLMRHEHYSPFAMCQVKLYVRLPIFVHNQWVRHDRFHWNVMSGRYSIMPTEKWTPAPEDLRGQGTGNKQVGDGFMPSENAKEAETAYHAVYGDIGAAYVHLLDQGVCREQARCVLPLATYTEAFVTASLGDWMQFLKQRLDSHAQLEIRVYAEAVLQILSDLFPVAMQAFKDYQLNSVRFSAQEMAVLLEYLKNPERHWIDIVNENIPNKREREEFLVKVKA
jgi:thymidylate synthase (FAD)